MDEDFNIHDKDNPTPELFAAVVGAIGQMPKIAESGGKGSAQPGLPYKFLSEKEILPAVAPIMVIHGLFIYPARQLKVSEYRAGKMTTRFIGTRYRLCHTGGGYIHVETYGEGFDAGDKACYKAMTGAYKYAIRQLFMLSGGEDPDNTPSPGAGGNAGKQSGNAPAKQSGDGTPAKFDPKMLPLDLRFKLYRDTLANAAAIPEVEQLMEKVRRVKFTPQQIAALESTALATATAIQQSAPPAGTESEPAM